MNTTAARHERAAAAFACARRQRAQQSVTQLKTGETAGMQGRVTVVGAGQVGITTAARLASSAQAPEIVVIDIVPGLAAGLALDLQHAGVLAGYDPAQIRGTDDYTLMRHSSVVVITAGSARRPDISRDDLLAKNRPIVREVARAISRHTPDSVVVLVTNPVEPLCHEVLDVLGHPERIIGLSGALDSARFAFAIAEQAATGIGEVSATVLGRHGDSAVPIVSRATVSGRPLAAVLDEQQIEAVARYARSGSGEVLRLLPAGSTYWAPAAAIERMVRAILGDTHEELPCTALCTGQYGIDELFVGVPVRLGASGIKQIVELEITRAELRALQASAAEVQALLGSTDAT